MRTTRTLGALAGLLVAGLTLVAAPTDAAPATPARTHVSASAPAAPAASDFRRPTVGTCHRLADPAVKSDTRKPVKCASRHNLLTIAAPLLHGKVHWNDSASLTRIAASDCQQALQRRLGTERRTDLSAYAAFFFVPTKAERAKGAKWLRCDLALYSGVSTRSGTVSLPRRVRPLGRGTLPDTVARCLAGKKLYTTVCARTHSYHAVATVAHRGGRYPSDSAWSAFGQKRCPRYVSTRYYAFSHPGKYDWKYGHQRLLVCYERSTS